MLAHGELLKQTVRPTVEGGGNRVGVVSITGSGKEASSSIMDQLQFEEGNPGEHPHTELCGNQGKLVASSRLRE